MIAPISEKGLQITVIDPIQRVEFYKKLTLTMKALEKKMIEVKMSMKVKKTP